MVNASWQPPSGGGPETEQAGRKREQARHESQLARFASLRREMASPGTPIALAWLPSRQSPPADAVPAREAAAKARTKPGRIGAGAIRFFSQRDSKAAERRALSIAWVWLRSGQSSRTGAIPMREAAAKARTKPGRIGLGRFALVIRGAVNPSPTL
jgi:hypothetical protein